MHAELLRLVNGLGTVATRPRLSFVDSRGAEELRLGKAMSSDIKELLGY